MVEPLRGGGGTSKQQQIFSSKGKNGRKKYKPLMPWVTLVVRPIRKHLFCISLCVFPHPLQKLFIWGGHVYIFMGWTHIQAYILADNILLNWI